MDLKTLDDWRPCDCAYGPPPGCWTTWFGHRFHWIHTMRLAETPWGWRDGVVSAVEDGWITVDHLAEDGHARLWHHEDLGAPVGTLVRVHEQWMGLSGRFGIVNAFITEGVGEVPTPEHPELWAQEQSVGVFDSSTGRGVDLAAVDAEEQG